MKTNAVRLLEDRGIGYELREYEVDPDNLRAELVAAKIGMPPDQVFKTLVVKGDRSGVCFAVVPGVRGTQILLAPEEYVRVTGARLGDIVRTKSEDRI